MLSHAVQIGQSSLYPALRRRPALSPDGKFVVYVQTSADGQDSVWTRQIATSSNVPIVAPEPGTNICGLTVTPDGAFVDVLRWRQPERAALWRVPLLGGPAKKIVDVAESGPAARQTASRWRSSPGCRREPSGRSSWPIGTAGTPALSGPANSRSDIRRSRSAGGRTSTRSGSPTAGRDGGRTDERDGNKRFVKVNIEGGAETPLSEHVPAMFAEAGFSLAPGPDGASVLATVPAESGGPDQY